MHSDYITSLEFNKRLRNKDVQALVAQMLSKTDFLSSNLALQNKFVLNHYMEKAKKLIKNMNEFNLKIIYEEENGI